MLTQKTSIADLNAVFESLNEGIGRTIHVDLQVNYRAAVQELRKSFEMYATIVEEGPLVFVWAVMLPDSFVIELEKKETLALVILAHYAVLLHGINEQWWAEGRGSQLVEAICQMLPSEWQPAVRWPKHVVQSNFELSLDNEN